MGQQRCLLRGDDVHNKRDQPWELLFLRRRFANGCSDQVVTVSNKDDEEVARLERLNEELSRSLKRCRSLLHDYEVRLAANSNESRESDDSEETREA